jgi:hypothetical protein
MPGTVDWHRAAHVVSVETCAFAALLHTQTARRVGRSASSKRFMAPTSTPTVALTLALAALALLDATMAEALGPAARLRLVDSDRFPLARCLDGSAPPFYFRPATSAAAKDKWFIHHMGGDFCGYGGSWGEWVENCRQRSLTSLGSSKWWSEHRPTWQLEAAGVDFFDADPSRSPLMHDWNWVYMVYW